MSDINYSLEILNWLPILLYVNVCVKMISLCLLHVNINSLQWDGHKMCERVSCRSLLWVRWTFPYLNYNYWYQHICRHDTNLYYFNLYLPLSSVLCFLWYYRFLCRSHVTRRSSFISTKMCERAWCRSLLWVS